MKILLSLFISSLYRLQRKLRGQHTSKWKCANGVGLVVGALMTAGATFAQAQVTPQFRTAPRSLITERVDRDRMVQTTGALSRTAYKYEDLGEAPAAMTVEHIQLLLRRPAERQAAFDAFVEAQHTKGSPSFHQWITPGTVGEEFGPSNADVTTINSFLASEGLTVNNIGKGGFYIDFTGTVAQLEHAFHTKIHTFKFPAGEMKYAPTVQASIPEALAPAVQGFVSLSNIHTAFMNHEHRVAPVTTPNATTLPPNTILTPQDTTVLNGKTYYAVGPQDFYTIYNENPTLSAGITGAGVTIALLEETDINTADVTTFRTTYGVNPATPVSLVVQHGAGSVSCADPGITSTDEEGEAVLDTEWAGAVAPGANLLFMSCPVGTDLGVVYSAQAVIDNNLADIMSLSYGDYEGDTQYGNVDDLVANLWEQATSQGETVVVSAGDSGAAIADDIVGNPYAINPPTASLYSSTAYNVSAGGTDFSDTYNGLMGDAAYGNNKYWSATDGTGLSSALSYIPESPWNNSCASTIYNAYKSGSITAAPAAYCGSIAAPTKLKPNINADVNIVAGSGGPSSEHARPSWQAASSVYGIPAATGSNAYRLQPDVSFFAANGLWNHFLEEYQSDNGGEGYAGGTSFVAPQLAGMFALIKQSTGERLGQPNYVLYNVAANEYGTTTPTNACNGSGASGAGLTSSSPSSSCIFYDVQVGNNAVTCGSTTDKSTGVFTDCDRTSTSSIYGVLDTTANTTGNNSTAIEAFYTGIGYDMATGIGSINISNLINAWPLPANSYTPTVTLAIGSASVAVYGTANPLTATVSGSGSYPTGSVTFTATPTVGSVGVATILGTAPCSTGGTCVEQATQSIYPAIPANNTQYSITATYSSTNENYVSGVTSSPVTVTIVSKQTPTTAVQNATAATSNPYAILTATITYSGVGAPPSGGMNFSLPTGAVLNGTCTGTTSPLACSVNYPISPATYPVGTYTISASYPGDTNYNAVATKTATLTINSGTAPTITFTTASPQYTMYPTVTLTSTSNSSGAKTYSVSGTTGTAAATISGSTLTLTGGSGTITVLLSQAAAGAYIAGSKSSTFTVKAGSIWVGDSTNDISTFDQSTGTAITPSPGLSGGGVGMIAFPQAEAFDAAGNLWIASDAGLSEFTPSASGPVAVSSTPYTVGGITTADPPLAVAVDGLGVIWVANHNGTITALTNSGVAISPSTGYTASGVAAKYTNLGGIAVDLSGSVWVTNSADGSVTQVLGVAAPVAPISTSLTSGTTGVTP